MQTLLQEALQEPTDPSRSQGEMCLSLGEHRPTEESSKQETVPKQPWPWLTPFSLSPLPLRPALPFSKQLPHARNPHNGKEQTGHEGVDPEEETEEGRTKAWERKCTRHEEPGNVQTNILHDLKEIIEMTPV